MPTSDALKKAIGRLILARLPGTSLDSQTEQMLAEGTIGGIVLFKEAQNLEQLFELVQRVHEVAFHPPVIAVDQEGGAVQRFDHILTPLPSAMALAAANDVSALKKVTSVSATQLKLLGVNCCFAPVLDVLQHVLNAVSTRSYGSDPQKVGELGLEAIKIYREAGIVPVGKHFPGHGSVLQDSHYELAVNPRETTALWQTDLVPFRSCLNNLPAIMVGHIWLSAIDQEPLPSTMSTRVIQSILRDYLKYPGLLISDDMAMQAVTKNWSMAEASLLAIKAGIDQLEVLGSIAEVHETQSVLAKAVESGDLTEDRILESNKRIEVVFGKSKAAVDKSQYQKRLAALEQSITQEKEEMLKVSTKAITCIRGAIPHIDSGEWLVLIPNHARYPLKLMQQLNDLAAKMKRSTKKKVQGAHFSEIRYSIDVAEEEIQTISKECVERNCIYLTFRCLSNQGQIILGQTIAENARERLNVACDSPYDLIGLPEWQNCIATFDPSDMAMTALAKILLGEAQAVGSCPVELNIPFSAIT